MVKDTCFNVSKSNIRRVLVPIGICNYDRLEKGEKTGKEQSQASRSEGGNRKTFTNPVKNDADDDAH